MKTLRTLLFLLVAGFFSLAYAQSTSQAYWSYIDQYKDWAIEQMEQYRIPASITLAQGLLESNAGRSTLATKANNHFGIKVGSSWTGPYVLRNDDAPNEKFRKYRSARESYIDHSKFLQGRRYQRLFLLDRNDYKGWAYGLKACGYATNPAYPEMLIRTIEMYNLHQFDNGSKHRRNSWTSAAATTRDTFFDHHLVYRNNKNYFIVVETGDNMTTISKETGVSLRKLFRYNELPRDYVPTKGDIIYLEKKRSCASREFRKNPIHIVQERQSLHDIAQLYGIRLSKLYKMNEFTPDHAVQVGDIIRIR